MLRLFGLLEPFCAQQSRRVEGNVGDCGSAAKYGRDWADLKIMSYKPFISCMLTHLAIILKGSRRKFHVFSYNKPYNGGNDRQYNRNYNTIWVYFQP